MRRELPTTQRALLVRALSLTAIAAIVALATGGSSSASASGTKHPGSSPPAVTIKPAPNDPNAAADKKYRGQTITFFGDSVGLGNQLDKAMATAFTKSTGIKVSVDPAPSSATDRYAATQRFFVGGSSAIDLTMIDVIWPGTFAPYLVDLKRAVGKDTSLYFSSIVKNDTIGGHLVAIPYFGDFGMLFYRKDLLKKYGYSAPPTTWTQLTAMAKKIQAGEQKTNKNFHGFVFQGNAYEGLTCDALEWIASYGGGTILTHSGQVTLDNPKAKAALKLAQSWVGTIAPRGVSAYQEEDARNAFQVGDAAFMRNWPYAYALASGSGSKVAGKFGVAPLPHGPGGKSSATVGGWQIAVSKHSKHLGAATAFAKYLTSKPVQIWRAVEGSFVPTMPSVGSISTVKKVMPFLASVGDHTARVTRPSAALGAKYNQGSTIFFQGVNSILNGQSVDSNVSSIASQLKNLHP